MDNDVEAGTERVCNYIRGPLASSGKLLNKNAGNTVNETLPRYGLRKLHNIGHTTNLAAQDLKTYVISSRVLSNLADAQVRFFDGRVGEQLFSCSAVRDRTGLQH